MNLSDNYNGSFWTNVLISIALIGSIYAMLVYIGYLYHNSQYFSLSFREMLTYKESFNSKIVFTLFSTIQYGSLLLIGYYIGGKAYRFSWLYGAIVGIVWMLVFLMATVLFTLFAIEQYTVNFTSQNPSMLQAQYKQLSLIFENLPLLFLKTAGITAIGGAINALFKDKFKTYFSSY